MIARHKRRCKQVLTEQKNPTLSSFTPKHTVYSLPCSVQFTLISAFCFAFIQITCVYLFCVHGPPLTQIAPHASLSSPSALFFDSSLIFPSFTSTIGTSFFGTCGIATPISIVCVFSFIPEYLFA